MVETPKTSPKKRALRVVAYVVFLLVVAEIALIVWTKMLTPQLPFDEYTYVPFVAHLTNIKDPNTTDGFRLAVGQDREGQPIWMFGGSTMQGGFSRETLEAEPVEPRSLPSHVGVLLSEREQPYSVHNFGQANFNSTQERILFHELLLNHPRPAIAIFYDGVNDLKARSNSPAYPNEYRPIRAAIERRVTPQTFLAHLERARVKLPFLLNFITNDRGTDKFRIEDFNPFLLVDSSDVRFPQALAETYVHNVRILDATCRAFEIECYFFWQPTVCFKDHVTEIERQFVEESCQSTRATDVLGYLRSDPWLGQYPRFFDLTETFRSETAHLYFDYCHIDEATEGHRVLAEAICDAVFDEQPTSLR